MGMHRKLLSNSFYLFVDMVIVNLFGLAFWFISGRFLAPEQVGIMSTAINLALLLSSLSLVGFQGALPKLIPEYLNNNQQDKIVGLARFAAKIILPVNIAIISVAFLGLPTFAGFIKLPLDAMAISMAILFFVSVSGFFGNIMYGHQNMRKFLQTDIVGVVSKVVISGALLFVGFNYAGPLIGVLIGFILICLMRFEKEWFLSKAGKVDTKKVIFDYSLPSFITTITTMICSSFQIILLAAMTTQATTGIYALTFLITSFIAFVPNILSQALFPIMSSLSAGSNVAKQSYLIAMVFRYSLFLIIPAAIFFTMFSRAIMYMIRPEYLAGVVFFPTLTLAAVLFGLGQMFLSNLYAIGKSRLQRNIWISLSIVFLISAITLTKYYSAEGMSFAYLMFAALAFLLGYHFLKNALKFRISWSGITKCLVSAGVFVAGLILLDVAEYGTLEKILLSAVAFLVYLVVLIPLRFYRHEDIRMLEVFAEKVPVARAFISKIARMMSHFTEK